MSDRFSIAPWDVERLTIAEYNAIKKYLDDEEREMRRQQRG